MEKKEMYLENYWPLFLDFINLFNELTYNSIPLPLLANFYQYLDSNLKHDQMTKSDFKKHLTTDPVSESQIQPRFEQWLAPIKRQAHQPRQIKPLSGKVLLNFDYLRFSPNNYSCFAPQETVILARFDKKDYHGMPIHCLNNYKVEVQKAADELVAKAEVIFTSVREHAVFGNLYFHDSFINLIPFMVESIAAADKYLEENPVSCIVVGTTEDLISRVIVLVAASKGIPSICMQHGLLGGDEAYVPVFATKVAVYGHYEKNWYLQKGLSENRIVITGHPRFDDIFTQHHISKAGFQMEYNLDMQKKTILLATQPFNTSLWKEIIEILAHEPQLEIIIKPHPWELSHRSNTNRKLIDDYQYFADKYRSVKLISKKGVNLYNILPNVDAVVNNLSTVGLEAMLFNKPLFILSNDMLYDYYKQMGEFIYSNPVELAKFIAEFFKDKELQQLAENRRNEFLLHNYPQKMSVLRLKEEINRLIEAS